MRRRLSLLQFLQFAAPGAVLPLFTLRLQELDFTPAEMGWACSTQAMSSLIGPLLAGQAADRWWPAQRCLAVCATVAGVLLFVLAELTTPLAVFGVSLATWCLLTPAITLGNTVCFTHLRDPEKDFSSVRLWGTVGWVIPCLLMGYWFADPEWLSSVRLLVHADGGRSELGDAFRLGGALALVLGLYALTLPHTPPHHRAGSMLAPLAALHLLRERAFAVYCLCVLGLCVSIPFSAQLAPLYLKQLGVPQPWLGPTLTIAQWTEVVSLALLPMVLLRLELRGTMLLGLLAWTTSLTMFSVGEPAWLVISSLGCNGLCVCCFLVAGQVFVNSRARGDIRTSAQALLTFTTGTGLLIGNLLVGYVREAVEGAFGPTFLLGASISAAMLLLFFLGFQPDRPTAPAVDEVAVPPAADLPNTGPVLVETDPSETA